MNIETLARRERARKRRLRRRLILGLAVLLAVIAAACFFLFRPAPEAHVPGASPGLGTLLGRGKAPVPPDELPEWIETDLLTVSKWSRPGKRLDAVNGIVVHYVGNPGTTAAQNRSYFESLSKTHEAYASSNFIIGLDGEVLLTVPLDEVAYCSNDRNYDTLSIECCHPDESGVFNEETYRSLVRLVVWLCDHYDLTREDILRHYDVTGKECPRYFVCNPDEWEGFLDAVEQERARGDS